MEPQTCHAFEERANEPTRPSRGARQPGSCTRCLGIALLPKQGRSASKHSCPALPPAIARALRVSLEELISEPTTSANRRPEPKLLQRERITRLPRLSHASSYR